MRKPKDIMQDHFIKSCLSDEDNLIYEKAMDVMSKNIAVGFAQWLGEKYIKSTREGVYISKRHGFFEDISADCFTIDQLYEKFISQS